VRKGPSELTRFVAEEHLWKPAIAAVAQPLGSFVVSRRLCPPFSKLNLAGLLLRLFRRFSFSCCCRAYTDFCYRCCPLSCCCRAYTDFCCRCCPPGLQLPSSSTKQVCCSRVSAAFPLAAAAEPILTSAAAAVLLVSLVS
jgi:hypothetical protein